jgi:hypothetical protein
MDIIEIEDALHLRSPFRGSGNHGGQVIFTEGIPADSERRNKLVKKEGDSQDKDLILGSLDRRHRNGPARLGIGSDLEGEHGTKKVPAWFRKEFEQ